MGFPLLFKNVIAEMICGEIIYALLYIKGFNIWKSFLLFVSYHQIEFMSLQIHEVGMHGIKLR